MDCLLSGYLNQEGSDQFQVSEYRLKSASNKVSYSLTEPKVGGVRVGPAAARCHQGLF